MKDLTKVFIDLSKCTEEQRKHIYSIIRDRCEFLKPDSYTYDCWKMLNYSTIDERWLCSASNWDGLKHKTELTYPEFIKLFEGGEGETSLQIALKALENIINPIGYMKSQLEEGDTFNGYAAVMIAEKPQFYQNIAKEALEKINFNQ